MVFQTIFFLTRAEVTSAKEQDLALAKRLQLLL